MTEKTESDAASAATPDGFTATDLRAENVPTLFGTEVDRPRLSWRIEANGSDVK